MRFFDTKSTSNDALKAELQQLEQLAELKNAFELQTQEALVFQPGLNVHEKIQILKDASVFTEETAKLLDNDSIEHQPSSVSMFATKQDVDKEAAQSSANLGLAY